jgi:triacylglycerol lipase
MPLTPFNPAATDFSLANAYFLAQASDLAYLSLSEAGARLKAEWGAVNFKPFDVNDTQAFLVANESAVVLAFRGTVTIQDWLTDARIKLIPSTAGRVHLGFSRALDHVWDDLLDTVLAWKSNDQTLWITGHSLGGALATLAANRLSSTDAGVPVAGLYTFGQPRVGDKAFAENFNREMPHSAFRMVNDEDAVTRVPWPPAYRHIGREYVFDREGTFAPASWWRKFVSRSESVAVRSSDQAADLRALNPGGFSDHSLNYYLRYLRENLERERGRPGTFGEYINR